MMSLKSYPKVLFDFRMTSLIIYKAGVHRVPVVNEQGEIINIISQTSLITFLNKHSSHFADFTKTVSF